jgi:hypothetical protein
MPVYSGCQKNVPVFKRFFYNRTFFYAALPYFGTLSWNAVQIQPSAIQGRALSPPPGIHILMIFIPDLGITPKHD